MITKLKFRNWRSLRNVEIDLAPITVFIGANSSGKTNILDALHFWNYSYHPGNRGVVGAFVQRQGISSVRTIDVSSDEAVSLQLTLKTILSEEQITVSMEFKNADAGILFRERYYEGDNYIRTRATDWFNLPIREMQVVESSERYEELNTHLQMLILDRWQLLGENFMPRQSVNYEENYDFYTLKPDTRNLTNLLDYMKSSFPNIFEALQDDLRFLLNYVDRIEIEQRENEMRWLLTEKTFGGKEAATISSGTARLVAMLTAFHALDMDLVPRTQANGTPATQAIKAAKLPGLVVIEEPDTALNPGLLRKFVEQIRYYVNDDKPRQVIFTTHNPQFLNYFEPEEVRVVERDEDGYTTVNPISSSIRNIWLDEYMLGEVWMTNSFGGKS